MNILTETNEKLRAPQIETPNELKLNVAGINISIRWNDSVVTGWPHVFYEGFVTAAEPEMNLRVHCGDLPAYQSDAILFDALENWKLYQVGGKYVIETFDTLTHERNKIAFLEPDFTCAEVFTLPEQWLAPIPDDTQLVNRKPICYSWSLPGLMQPLGQVLLLNFLAAHEMGIMVHALGISDNGKGIAFVGPSGSGKSTLAEIWGSQDGITILGDERIIIRKIQDKIYVSGSPWPGDAMTVSSEIVPLEEIYFIYHAQENTAHDQLAISSLHDLFSQSFLSFWDREAMEFGVEFCVELIRAKKCKKLGFVNDGRIVEFVRGAR